MKYIIWCVGLLLLTTNACKNTSSTTPKNVAQQAELVAGLSGIDINNLVQQADFVDFLFYHMDISVSQEDIASIQTSAKFFSAEVKPANMQCAAIGRISFLSKGKIIREADIHLIGACSYFTIIENKLAKGTNRISPEGVNFLQTLMNSYQKPK